MKCCLLLACIAVLFVCACEGSKGKSAFDPAKLPPPPTTPDQADAALASQRYTSQEILERAQSLREMAPPHYQLPGRK